MKHVSKTEDHPLLETVVYGELTKIFESEFEKIYVYIYTFKKKQNRSHLDYKFISILLCVLDINQKHKKNPGKFKCSLLNGFLVLMELLPTLV